MDFPDVKTMFIDQLQPGYTRDFVIRARRVAMDIPLDAPSMPDEIYWLMKTVYLSTLWSQMVQTTPSAAHINVPVWEALDIMGRQPRPGRGDQASLAVYAGAAVVVGLKRSPAYVWRTFVRPELIKDGTISIIPTTDKLSPGEGIPTQEEACKASFFYYCKRKKREGLNWPRDLG